MERHCQIPILTSRLMEASETVVTPRLATARGKWEAVGFAAANCQAEIEIERRIHADIGRSEVWLAMVTVKLGNAIGELARVVGKISGREGWHLDKQQPLYHQYHQVSVGILAVRRGKTFRLAGHSGLFRDSGIPGGR